MLSLTPKGIHLTALSSFSNSLRCYFIRFNFCFIPVYWGEVAGTNNWFKKLLSLFYLIVFYLFLNRKLVLISVDSFFILIKLKRITNPGLRFRDTQVKCHDVVIEIFLPRTQGLWENLIFLLHFNIEYSRQHSRFSTDLSQKIQSTCLHQSYH